MRTLLARLALPAIFTAIAAYLIWNIGLTLVAALSAATL